VAVAAPNLPKAIRPTPVVSTVAASTTPAATTTEVANAVDPGTSTRVVTRSAHIRTGSLDSLFALQDSPAQRVGHAEPTTQMTS
jgi:hypothetical protein